MDYGIQIHHLRLYGNAHIAMAKNMQLVKNPFQTLRASHIERLKCCPPRPQVTYHNQMTRTGDDYVRVRRFLFKDIHRLWRRRPRQAL